MIVFAAIDLQAGEVVQLEGGRADALRVRWSDPVAVAHKWVESGFRELHVVDLDAARGTGSNRDLIESIIAAVDVPVQVGGGIRDDAAIQRTLDAGAARVIIGTRAIEDSEWRRAAAVRFPGRLVVAADVRDQLVVTRGWTRQTELHWRNLLPELEQEPLAALLVTDVSREGRVQGVDVELFASICAASTHDVFAAGGIAGNQDVISLSGIGAAGAVLGMSLYTNRIDLAALSGALP